MPDECKTRNSNKESEVWIENGTDEGTSREKWRNLERIAKNDTDDQKLRKGNSRAKKIYWIQEINAIYKGQTY